MCPLERTVYPTNEGTWWDGGDGDVIKCSDVGTFLDFLESAWTSTHFTQPMRGTWWDGGDGSQMLRFLYCVQFRNVKKSPQLIGMVP